MKTKNTNIINGLYICCLCIVEVLVVIGIILCRDVFINTLSISYVRDVAVDTMGMLIPKE